MHVLLWLLLFVFLLNLLVPFILRYLIRRTVRRARTVIITNRAERMRRKMNETVVPD